MTCEKGALQEGANWPRREARQELGPTVAEVEAVSEHVTQGDSKPSVVPLASTSTRPVHGFAISDFDGAAYGAEYLTFVKGVDLVQLPHVQRDGWALGAVLASPVGFFPAYYFGRGNPTNIPDTSLPFQGEMQHRHSLTIAYGEALYDFDGSAYGKEYLIFVRGARLVLLPHPNVGGGWVFGAQLLEPSGWFPTEFFVQWDVPDRATRRIVNIAPECSSQEASAVREASQRPFSANCDVHCGVGTAALRGRHSFFDPSRTLPAWVPVEPDGKHCSM